MPPSTTRARLAALLLALIALASCGQSASDHLTVTGSTSMTPFVEHLAEIYQHEHAGSAIDVQGLGSSAGIRAAIDGVSELGMSSRSLKDEEAAKLDQLVLARDALVIVVHPSNPVRSLTIAQIKDLFSGRIRSWDALGGPARPVVLVSREAGSGTFSAFEELIMKGEPVTPATLRQGSNGAVRQIVADDPDAIGYISLGIVDTSVRAVAIEGVEPSLASVEAGQYKMVRPFLIVWQRGRTLSELATAFLAYAQSPAAQELLVRDGLVPGEVQP